MMSGEWMGVALITALLLIMMGYSVLLAFRPRRPRKRADQEGGSTSEPQPRQKTDRKAA